MSLLLYSGLLYLVGVSVILYWKPELMFNKEGEWKEFGLGRNKERYTWLPFWMFTLLWAILSYLIVLTCAGDNMPLSTLSTLSTNESSLSPENISMKSLPSLVRKKPSSAEEMKQGYYIMDTNETIKQGVPKYIYLGPKAPNVIFHEQESS
jgi:hypothetical protein